MYASLNTEMTSLGSLSGGVGAALNSPCDSKVIDPSAIIPPKIAVTVAVPASRIVTTPCSFTLAISGSVELYEK